MRVVVASENPVKVRAVGRALDQRPDLVFNRANMICVPSVSGVPEQPYGDETAQGAVNRVRHLIAQDVYDPATHLFVGIESGLFLLGDDSNRCVMDNCVVYMQWADWFSFGTSSGFMLPDKIGTRFADLQTGVLRRGDGTFTIDDAAKELGFTDQAHIGAAVGLVGLLSGGRASREDCTFEAVRNALFGICEPFYKLAPFEVPEGESSA